MTGRLRHPLEGVGSRALAISKSSHVEREVSRFLVEFRSRVVAAKYHPLWRDLSGMRVRA